MDESGDLGFDFKNKPKTSKNFIITFLFTQNKRRLDKMVKKTFCSLPKNKQKKHIGVLHCYKEKPVIRMKLLNLLKKEKNVHIMAIKLNKRKVHTKLQDEKVVLYNFVTNILLDRILTKKLIPTNKVIHLIASRRENNKYLNENFRNYIKDRTNTNHNLKIKVEIKRPYEEKCLQVVDFASWSIFRKEEHKDIDYYKIIENIIIEENVLFT